MSRDVSFSAEAYSLDDAIKRKRKRFPIVVRASDSLDVPTRQFGLDHMGEPRLEPGVIYLLQQIVKIEFAHVRILRYQDGRSVTRIYGGEFVADHDNFIDREFLIPKKFPGKLKVVQRPRGTSVYQSALQVHEDFPHYIKLKCEATCDKTTGKNRVLTKGSNLELIGRSNKYIECVDRSNPIGPTFKFHMNTQLSCSAVEDTRMYTLQTLDQIALPKVIQFADIPISEVSMVLDDEKENIRCMTSGPIEVLGSVQKEMIVSWTQNPSQTGFKAVLVPVGRWSKELVLVGHFMSDPEKRAYIAENFELPTKTTFLQKSFYMTPTDDQTITELLEVSSDSSSISEYDDSSLYEVPAGEQQPGLSPDRSPDCPFYPPTKPVVDSFSAAGTVGKNAIKVLVRGSIDVKAQIAKKAEWFRLIHKDIRTVFQLREKTVNKPTSVNKAAYGCFSEMGGASQERNPRSNQKPTSATKPEIKPKPKPKVVTPSSQRSASPTDEDYEQVEPSGNRPSGPGRAAWKKNSQGSLRRVGSEKQERRYANDETLTRVHPGEGYVNRDAISGYLSPTTENHQDQSGYDDLVVKGLKGTERDGPGYSQITGFDLKSIARKNQTCDDFYNYSVNELRECFKMCKLNDFADACFEDGLDGKFFESFEFGQLKADPFNLTDFQITKVKKIINDGWRPNYEFPSQDHGPR